MQTQKDYLKIKNDYLKSFDEWLSYSGINPVIGNLMQLFRTEDRPLTQGEMKKALNLSKATISRNLKAMEQMNLLKINEILPIQIIGDKYNYELIDNSLIYITTTFLKRIYDSFRQRNEENKVLFEKLSKLRSKIDNKNNIEFEKLFQMIKEETIVFETLKERFEKMINELEEDMIKVKNQETMV